MKILLTSISLFALSHIQAQKSELLDISQKQEIDSILSEFKESKNLQFLALAPSVGYDPVNNNFNIGFNLSNLTNYIQTRRRNRIEISRLQVQLEEKAIRENEIRAREEEDLKRQFLDFQIRFQAFMIDHSNFQIWTHLHEIAVGKHKAGDITTEDFLRAKLQYSNQFKTQLIAIKNLILQAGALNDRLHIPEYQTILAELEKTHLQIGENSGVLGAEPLMDYGSSINSKNPGK